MSMADEMLSLLPNPSRGDRQPRKRKFCRTDLWKINLKSVQLILTLLFRRTSLMENAKMTPILDEILNDAIIGR